MAKYQAEKYTLLIAFIIIVLLVVLWLIFGPKIDHLAGFNITFDYQSDGYTGTPTFGQLDAAKNLGIYNFRWVESPQQEQNTSTLQNLSDILYDDPSNPSNPQKFDMFFTIFVNNHNKLMMTVPYNDFNNPKEWQKPSSKHVSRASGQTVPLLSPITNYDFINRIEFSLMRNQLENTGAIQYPLSNHLIISLYAEALNQPGTTTVATPAKAMDSLLHRRIIPCLNFVKRINTNRQKHDPPLTQLELVFPLEVQPQIYNSVDDLDTYDPMIFDLQNPATTSRDYPMDSRATQAYGWWSTSQYHSEKANAKPSEINLLLDMLKLNHTQFSKFGVKTKGYIALSIYPIIWQTFNLKARSEGNVKPAQQDINDYIKLVKERVKKYEHYITKYTGLNLLISEFGWPGSCGGLCRSAGCMEDFEAMRPNTSYKQQKKEQCLMWQVFKSLDCPKYYWTLGADPRHSMCGNSVQQMINGPGDDNGWRITDKNTGNFIC